MSAAEVHIDLGEDVDMSGRPSDGDAEEGEETLAEGEYDAEEEEEGEGEQSIVAASKPSFVDYLRSPIVEIVVGTGDSATQLFAHEALLAQSAFFSEQIGGLAPGRPRRVSFAGEDLDAMGAFLQFLYTGEYYPRKTGAAQLEGDGASDEDGTELLRHARVYTLAERLGVGELKALAHSKVHRVNSSARGEIVYARYVYGNTPKDDDAIRRPIASFWGQRSHVLRHEAEPDFRALCIEFPEFAFDVLSYVLDARERRGQRDSAAEQETPRSGRKRARHI